MITIQANKPQAHIIAFPQQCLKYPCWDAFRAADRALGILNTDNSQRTTGDLTDKAYQRARMNVLLKRVEDAILQEENFVRVSHVELALLEKFPR